LFGVTAAKASAMADSSVSKVVRLGRTELLFDFRPSLLDGIEVRRIGR
jgi:hypothetical protein